MTDHTKLPTGPGPESLAGDKQQQRPVPIFEVGDTVKIDLRFVEGETTAIRTYEAVCIARSGTGLNQSFTVRKTSYGEGVEHEFPLFSPMIDSIQVIRRGDVRRAKLIYLRGMRSKGARVFGRTDALGNELISIINWKGFKKPKGEANDLTKIKVISAELQSRLNKLGVTRFEQIVKLSPQSLRRIDKALGLEGRIENEDWIRQARALTADATIADVQTSAEAPQITSKVDQPSTEPYGIQHPGAGETKVRHGETFATENIKLNSAMDEIHSAISKKRMLSLVTIGTLASMNKEEEALTEVLAFPRNFLISSIDNASFSKALSGPLIEIATRELLLRIFGREE